MVIEAIDEHNLPPLTQKRTRASSAGQAKRIKYDYQRAEESVFSDWVGEVPTFPDKQFEDTFRIKRHMVDIILNHLCRRNSFWIKGVCRAGKETINPYVKLLCALKMICYGISGNAFLDYHQFRETTSRRCVHHLVTSLVTCPALAEVYLRIPTKADAVKVTTMHKNAHKMPGMLGSLDVTKVHWKKCPTALKGQFQGREKCATIALEAVVYHNLWFWHGSFEFPGTLNDINMWERSSLLESMLNGRHDQIDHQYTLDNKPFKKLYYLVDGIYPSLSRFLGTETDPSTRLDGSFKVDQEAARKDVERGFGVLKLKFLSLTHPINLHHRDDIYCLVMATILLHNMMVEERVADDDVEDGAFYNTICNEDNDENEEETDNDDEAYSSTPAGRHEKFEMVHRRWAELYNYEGSKYLKDAMKRHLYSEKFGKNAMENAHLWMDNFNPLHF
eukprot:CCRYP_000680-RA/>CCRYP_000680-RA protein AED:0.00 eAED:0.00 QI:23/-1/1/1/-1/1/1/26/445